MAPARRRALAIACLICWLPPRRARAEVLTGIDVLEADGFRALKGKRVGLITNRTGRDRAGRSTAQIMAETPGVDLEIIFAPEHGITATVTVDDVPDSRVALGGREIPVRSLSPTSLAHMHPRQEDLKSLDIVVFDIQDIGARFYTYLATMGMAMEETKKAGIEFMVLDRPNPLTGRIVEGPILDDLSLRNVTSTAYYPVSVRHGMTAGEIARMYDAELHHPKLTVIPLQGWSRRQWYDQTGLPSWMPPSPNIPDLDSATMYPGIGIFETSNLAVGRRSPHPFRWVGAPWMDAERVVQELRRAGLEGVQFAAQDETPAEDPYKGMLCHGVLFQVSAADRDRVRPTEIFLALVAALEKVHRENPSQEGLRWSWTGLKRMVGTERFRETLESRDEPDRFKKLRELFEKGSSEFQQRRLPYLLYF